MWLLSLGGLIFSEVRHWGVAKVGPRKKGDGRELSGVEGWEAVFQIKE